MNTKIFTRATAGVSSFFLTLFLSFSIIGMAAAPAFAATPTVSVISISPSSTITVGTPVTFAVATSGFVDPYYSLSDAFDGGSLGSADLNSAGEFSWTPYNNDVGSHVVTITAHDTMGDSATTEVTLTVQNAGSSTVVTPSTSAATSAFLSIESVSPSASVTSGQMVSFYAVPTGFTTVPTYTVSDTFTGTTITSSDINSSGEFFWTPLASDAGEHTVTVTATDSAGQTASSEVGLLVTAASAPVTTTSTVSPAVPMTPVTTTATFTENLSLGSTGAQVTALQEVLIAQGDLKAAATGYYGSETEAAVKLFQSEHDVSQLGIVGPETRAVLNSLGTGTTDTTASADVSTTGTTASATVIAEIQSEIQSITASLSQIETQIASI